MTSPDPDALFTEEVVAQWRQDNPDVTDHDTDLLLIDATTVHVSRSDAHQEVLGRSRAPQPKPAHYLLERLG